MKQSLVPIYNDPTGFEDGSATYPCSTQFMVYNGLLHKYYLTEETLNYYGVDVERKYVSDSPNKMREFIEKVSDKIYNYIGYKSGWANMEIQIWRIAKSLNRYYQDKYTFRKMFEKVLVYEAQWLIVNGDSASLSNENLDKNIRDVKRPEEDWMDTSDIATESKRALHFMGLDKWFTLQQPYTHQQDEY